MQPLYQYVTPPGPCGYLSDRLWQLHYDFVLDCTPAEYFQRMCQGWRRFGGALFRPQCPSCNACQSLRVDVARFRPTRSQRRCRALNEGVVQLRRGQPEVTRAKLDLYDRYHAYQAEARGWPEHPAKDADSYADSFVDNPFPTEEWCYHLGGRLVGVGYVDVLPGGLSAIYFFYDPEQRHRSLGTWNVLNLLDAAARARLPHVYLGYYVAGSPSMVYKSKFVPNEILGTDGTWHSFQE